MDFQPDRDQRPKWSSSMTGLALTPPEHAHSAAVEEAARWYADQPEGSVRPIVPALQQRFGLTAKEACECTALAGRYRMLRRAFG